MKKQTLVQAIQAAFFGGLNPAADRLEGCPLGGWGETTQAWREISALLPPRAARTYTVHQFVEATYEITEAERYQRRMSGPAMAEAARIEAEAAANTVSHYVCEGSVRGSCGHKHRTVTTAEKCQHRDHVGCRRQGGYSDRYVYAVMLDGSVRALDDADERNGR